MEHVCAILLFQFKKIFRRSMPKCIEKNLKYRKDGLALPGNSKNQQECDNQECACHPTEIVQEVFV